MKNIECGISDIFQFKYFFISRWKLRYSIWKNGKPTEFIVELIFVVVVFNIVVIVVTGAFVVITGAIVVVGICMDFVVNAYGIPAK